jgi:hypothetical protein
MQVQQSSHPHRTNISLSSPEGGDFRTTHSMITPYRYPASFDPVFAALDQPQGIDYTETPEVPMQADILELQRALLPIPIHNPILALPLHCRVMSRWIQH